MTPSGTLPYLAGLCLLLSLCSAKAAEKPSGFDLDHSAQSLIWQVLDLQYPVQDMGGAPVQTGQKKEDLAGEGKSLSGEVLDLKAAGADIKESETEIKISLQGEILFDFDKANLRPAAEPTLMQIAGIINKYPKP